MSNPIADPRLECLRLIVDNNGAREEAHKIVQDARVLEAYINGQIATEESSKTEEVEAKPAKTKAKKAEPFAEPEPDAKSTEPTYADAKNAILEVVKLKGRDASLDVLALFNNDEVSVVTGAGKERKGDMSKLKPEQYGAVIDECKKVLA